MFILQIQCQLRSFQSERALYELEHQTAKHDEVFIRMGNRIRFENHIFLNWSKLDVEQIHRFNKFYY